MGDSAPPVTGQLAGAAFRFRTDCAPLLAYAQAHLATLAEARPRTPAVDVELHWHEGSPPAATGRQFAALERVDRDLYAGTGELHWFRVDDLRDLHLHCAWRDERLHVRGDYYHRLSQTAGRDRVKRVLYRRRLPLLRQRRFTTLLYYTIYYPCWWWLEQVRNFHPLHAAGVQTTRGLVLLAGASGVGKSTLSVALATEPGAALLSDSFVMQRGTEVLPVREPVLLDAWSRRWLGERMAMLDAIDGCYGLNRDGFHLRVPQLSDGGPAALLVLPRRAPHFRIRPVAAAEAQARVSAANLIINDLRRYWAFAAVLEQLQPAGLVARREAELAKLTAEIPCVELGLTPEVTPADAVAAMLQAFAAERLRVANARM